MRRCLFHDANEDPVWHGPLIYRCRRCSRYVGRGWRGRLMARNLNKKRLQLHVRVTPEDPNESV